MFNRWILMKFTGVDLCENSSEFERHSTGINGLIKLI